ncbi:MAG: hypothetical protein KF744_14725 [Taibaiella sp.]|nr:hypothetical protein [Taibaiella sp.]
MSPKIEKIIPYLIGAAVLMYAALYNGYPIYGGDTHAYVTSGFTGQIPFDRSPFYGIFLRHSSLAESLWFTILAQCLLLSYVTIKYFRMLLGKPIPRVEVALMLVAGFLTFISFVASALMADVFTPILFLSTMLLLFDESASPPQQWLYLGIAFVSITMHNSHSAITISFSAIILIYGLLKKSRRYVLNGIKLMSASILSIIITCSMNASAGYGFVFSKSSSAFVVAKYAETGILRTYFDENCEREHLRMCAFKDNLTPYPWDFMFSEYSPLNKAGGYDSCEQELNFLAKDVLSVPKLRKTYAIHSLFSVGRQLCEIQEREKIVSLPFESFQVKNIWGRFPAERNQFVRSKQTEDKLNISAINIADNAFLIISTLSVLLFFPKLQRKGDKKVYAVLAALFLINAAVTAILSTVDPRYSYRILWLLPATNAALIARYINERIDSAQHSD